MIRKLLDYLSEDIVNYNSEFKNLHFDEECYILGNGNSLKYFDITKFKDKPIFGCNLLKLHKDFNQLNVDYYITTHPLLHSPIWRGSKGGLHLEKNPFYHFWKKNKPNNHKQFVHISDYPFVRRQYNYRFIHNLSKHPISLKYCDPTVSFSFCGGALEVMLGLAIYMGFKSAYLIGCDYFFKPMISGHFWSNQKKIGSSNFVYNNLVSVLDKQIDLRVITRNKINSHLNNINYSDYMGVEENYRSEVELVTEENLMMLRHAKYLRL